MLKIAFFVFFARRRKVLAQKLQKLKFWLSRLFASAQAQAQAYTRTHTRHSFSHLPILSFLPQGEKNETD